MSREDEWMEWLGHLRGTHAHGLELGTWKGDSAAWMLGNIFTGQFARYSCVDTFEGSVEHRLAGVDCSGLEEATRVGLLPYWERTSVFKGRTDEVLTDALRHWRFDFVMVDAACDARSVLRDSVLAWRLLKAGGVMIWPNYGWALMADETDRPKIAIDAFLSCYAREIEILGLGDQAAVKKLAGT